MVARFAMRVERSGHPFLFFSWKERAKIIGAIRDMERKTSGEIRVHLVREARSDILSQARETFQGLGMTRTRARNGVLLFLGVRSRRFAVVGDLGIHEKVGPDFWTGLADQMTCCFERDDFAAGVVQAVREIGEKLREHFPGERHDLNELPDEISYA